MARPRVNGCSKKPADTNRNCEYIKKTVRAILGIYELKPITIKNTLGKYQ